MLTFGKIVEADLVGEDDNQRHRSDARKVILPRHPPQQGIHPWIGSREEKRQEEEVLWKNRVRHGKDETETE